MFENNYVPLKPNSYSYYSEQDKQFLYAFSMPSPRLSIWSRLFQFVVSQVGTYLYCGKFHDGPVAINKYEGGCKIYGVGDLVLGLNGTFFDSAKNDDVRKQVTSLINEIVLNWNPNDPINSIIDLACNFAKIEDTKILHDIMEKHKALILIGDDLNDFFNKLNPRLPDKEYRKFCYVKFSGYTEKEADQVFEDEELAKSLLKKLKDRQSYVWCCVPQRSKDGLKFWVSSSYGGSLFNGWKTETEILSLVGA